MEVNIDWSQYGQLPTRDEQVAMLRGRIHAANSRLSRHVATLLSHADILGRLQQLHAGTSLVQEYVETADFEGEDAIIFFASLMRPYYDAVSHARELEELHLSCLLLDDAFVAAVTSQRHLHTIALRACTIEAVSQAQSSDTVLNAIFTFRAGDGSSSWAILPLLPKLRSLEVFASPDVVSILPPPDIRNAVHLFNTLERIFLSGVSIWEVPMLAEWISHAPSSNLVPIRLTHFKLETKLGIAEEDMNGLLAALEGAPMRYFVVDGIRCATPQLLDRIAHAFPTLCSLTLIYRDSDRQTRGKMAEWPFPTWEYAPHLAGFHHLKHFGWNFFNFRVDPSPSVLLLMELNYTARSWEVADSMNDNLSDWDSVARMFAAFCPSLTSFALVTDSSALILFNIHRRPGGVIEAEQVKSTHAAHEVHNPSSLISSWPQFYPSDA